ncbi:MAG: hypothetical protein VX317_09510, partial [Verrucomicrobiota bacterium]|nr:hypothetical protein [Verrucomicrobiota bacterium]
MNRLGVFAFLACALNCQAQLKMESLPGDGVWVDPRFQKTNPENRIRAVVWFEKQFLGNGTAFLRRAKEFDGTGRTKLRAQVLAALKAASESSRKAAQEQLSILVEAGTISSPQYIWIVNGFT